MKPMTKRLFSLLLAVILLLGLSTSAMAATDSGSTDETTEMTVSTTGPTQESDPEEGTEETEPTDPTEPTEEPTNKSELAIHPDPIYEENPFDPEWPYPYGLPVDNDFPADLLEDDPYAIAPYADMSKIPEEMYDSYILRALEYTGYDVQYLKNNGYLFVAQYTSSNLSTYAPQVLSSIGYDDYSPYLNGDETVADATTVSGKAPNIALFESNGLVCASFVSYYWNNYLPNIEGIDTTWVADAVKATTMNNGSYSTASVYAWETGLTNLANTPGSGVTRYTDATTAYANLVPGDVIIFSNSSGKLVHAAIYAGTYTMYNASGTNRGDYHYIIHACYDLGWMHQQGLGCEKNEEEAQRWFTMALESFRNAEQAAKKPGYLRYRIGKCYAYGHGTEQNYEESARWFQRAVAENNPFAAYSLGGQYLRGQGVEQSDAEAYSLFFMAANHGNAYAQYQLGRMCKDGIGTEVDWEESKLWYAKAYAGFLRMEETMADDKLYYRLGSMNMSGTGTEINLEQAEIYFQKAVELGNADALYGLGKLYLKAEFHGYDPHKAVEYLEQAAENGNSFAEYQLGKIFYFGNGIRADTKKGLEYLQSAATHGNEYATNLLQAIQHQQTVGVAQCTASLIAQLGRMFQEQEQKQSQRQSQRMDRKYRREIEEKKQAMGLKG